MISDPDMVDDIRAMGNRVLGRLSKQIEDFKQIKAKLLEDYAFGATYAISTCELLSNIKEKFFDKIKQCLKDFGGENIRTRNLKKGIKVFLRPYIVKSNSTVLARRYFYHQ